MVKIVYYKIISRLISLSILFKYLPIQFINITRLNYDMFGVVAEQSIVALCRGFDFRHKYLYGLVDSCPRRGRDLLLV